MEKHHGSLHPPFSSPVLVLNHSVGLFTAQWGFTAAQYLQFELWTRGKDS